MSARTRWLALLLIPVLFAVLPAQNTKGRKFALLVGVQDYTGTGLSSLKYCDNDVNDLGKLLPSLGYPDEQVTLMTQAAAFERKQKNLFPTADNIRKHLKGLVEDLRPEDTVLIAFSGHECLGVVPGLLRWKVFR